MIAILILTNLVFIAVIFFMGWQLRKASSYARKADLERIALGIQVGVLKEQQDLIAFK